MSDYVQANLVYNNNKCLTTYKRTSCTSTHTTVNPTLVFCFYSRHRQCMYTYLGEAAAGIEAFSVWVFNLAAAAFALK